MGATFPPARRAGFNWLDAEGMTTPELLKIDFDQNPPIDEVTRVEDLGFPFEYFPLSGDSGGGWFANSVILGPLVGITSTEGPRPTKTFKGTAKAVRVGPYIPWITSVIVSENSTGDIDENGVVDVNDLSALAESIRAGDNHVRFDVNSDLHVDFADLEFWVHDVADTYFGDSNLDGEFDSSDFVTVFKAGEYEDDIEMNSGWAEGDWNGDGDFNTRDFVFAFQDGGYEQGPRVASVVPEPSSVFLVLLGVAVLFARMRSN